MALRIAVYTSNRATRLCSYIRGEYPGVSQIKVVVHDGQPTKELSRLCELNNIDLVFVDYSIQHIIKAERGQYLSNLLLDKLSSHSVDYCFCFGGRILVGDLLVQYRNRIINFHPSLLPSFAGLRAIDQAIEYGSPLLGNTAHFIDEGVDTGPIIMQSFLPRSAYDGYDSVLDLQMPMLAQIIKWLEEGRISITGRQVEILDAKVGSGGFVPGLDVTV